MCGGFCAPGCEADESCVSGVCEPTVTTNWWNVDYSFRLPIAVNIPIVDETSKPIPIAIPSKSE